MHYSADIISTGKISFENGQVQVLTSAMNPIFVGIAYSFR